MCGIFLYLSQKQLEKDDRKNLTDRSYQIKHRGPDKSSNVFLNSSCQSSFYLGFHRLAIVDTSDSGMMPFYSKNKEFVLIMNGEIYNHLELFEYLNSKTTDYEMKSKSDCEVVVHLFKYFLEQESKKENSKNRDSAELGLSALKIICEKLDGEFALAIVDKENNRVFFAVDELRARPLFYAFDDNGFYLASEQKCLKGLGSISVFPSGGYGSFSCASNASGGNAKKPKIEGGKSVQKVGNLIIRKYFDLDSFKDQKSFRGISFPEASEELKKLLIESVELKIPKERKGAFLLSGGLDSSLVCAIAARAMKKKNQKIKTFTFAFSSDAPDAVAAEKVAKFIDSDHQTFVFDMDEGKALVEEVIKFGETWDQTSIRASTAMYLGLKKLKEEHPGIAVVMSGEVADELLRGYLYNLCSPNVNEGRNDLLERLRDLTYFDGLRADRMVAAVGCELRLPFFCKSLLKFVLELPPELLDPKANGKIEKKLLRAPFEGYLPEALLKRTKNALSDATSAKSGWKEHLKKAAEKNIDKERFSGRAKLYPYCTPQTEEDFWYREIFEANGYNPKCIPYKWMPQWAGENLTDSSATALQCFHED